MREQALRTLKLTLFYSVLSTFIALVNLSIQIIELRPWWLVTISCLPIPAFLILLTVIGWDLRRQEAVVIRGEVIGKDGSRLQVAGEQSVRRRFRVRPQDISDIEVHARIELELLKRTRTVVRVTRLDADPSAVIQSSPHASPVQD